jgi:hypothetical protein
LSIFLLFDSRKPPSLSVYTRLLCLCACLCVRPHFRIPLRERASLSAAQSYARPSWRALSST